MSGLGLSLKNQKKRFRIASEEDILSGKTTDVYFERTKQILEHVDVDRFVAAEFTASSLPDSTWGVIAGIDNALSVLEGHPVDVFAVEEGTIFSQFDRNGYRVPLLLIVGNYLNFGIYETPILGFICSMSGMVTRTLQIRRKAQNKTLLSFGARRAHPAITPVVSYSAYIGGCDGVSCIEGARQLGLKPSGTIPHALVIIMKDQKEAWLAFDKYIETDVPRIALVDTYSDEKFESIDAAETLPNLWGVRLDTPSSRRGNFKQIINEVRWELNQRGFEQVKIFVSGGLGESEVEDLVNFVDGFGIGSAISAAPPIDFAMDIVERRDDGDWTPCAKRGKLSFKKQLWRCLDCFEFEVTPFSQETSSCMSCGKPMEKLLQKVIDNGKRIVPSKTPQKIREDILKQSKKVKVSL